MQAQLLSWRHSGFSAFLGEPIRADDPERLERLARYVRRTHLAESRVLYDEEREEVIYSSGKKPHPKFKANFRIFKAQDFLVELCEFIPDPKRHESLAYGEYANAVRGKRAKANALPLLAQLTPLRQRLKASWRELLLRIYEVDPLLCPCGGKLRRLSLSIDSAEIRQVLLLLGRWPPPRRLPRPSRAPPPPSPRRAEPRELPLSEAEGSQLPLWEDQDEIWSQLPSPEEG